MALIRRINHENSTDLQLDNKMLTFGRDESNDVSVDKYHDISRNHCGFTRYEDGIVTITDYSSRNGTFVNGEKIFEETKLKHRDEVIICKALQFVFLDYDSEAGKKELAEEERKRIEEEERKKKAVVVKGNSKLSDAMSEANADLDEGKEYKSLMDEILKGTKKKGPDIKKKNRDTSPDQWVNKYE
jgi:pSer/pThr/pTyr-binding forkhead associated (FHA) protein